MASRANQEIAPLPPGMGRVVFVRPASACDTFDHAVLVDEDGKFVANLSGGTAFSADVAPGRKAFFVWPGMDLRTAKERFRPVSVVDLLHAPGVPRVIQIGVIQPREGRGECYRESVFRFERPLKEFDADSLSGVRLVESNQEAGDAYLRERNELSAAYFRMAHDALIEKRSRKAESKTPFDGPKKSGSD